MPPVRKPATPPVAMSETDPLLLGPTRQTANNINVIMKTPSRERFNEFLSSAMGQHLLARCAAVVPLASHCFPKTCRSEESGEMEVADSMLSFAYRGLLA